jgi:elongation factor G
MDSICTYLPSPLDRPPVTAHQVTFRHSPRSSVRKQKKGEVTTKSSEAFLSDIQIGNQIEITPDKHSKNPLCALAFKVKYDNHRGFIVWVRVYHGELKKNSEVLNTNTNMKEKIVQLYKIDADQIEPIDVLSAGDIGAVVGLTSTSTGHTLSHFGHTVKKFVQIDQPLFTPPVFMQTIEPDTFADQKELDNVLEILQLEDPTFHVKVIPETEEIVVCGLGELHLQIIENRLKELFTKPFRLGSVLVSERQSLVSEDEFTNESDLTYSGKKESFQLSFQLGPNAESTLIEGEGLLANSNYDNNIFEDSAKKSQCSSNTNREEIIDAIKEGVKVALYNGYGGFPVINARVSLTSFSFSLPTPQVAYIAAEMTLRGYLMKAELQLLEPVMKVEITVDEQFSGDVIGELTHSRKGTVRQVQSMGNTKVIEAIVPLRSMLGYSNTLRSIARGNCSYSMEFSGYDFSTTSRSQKDDDVSSTLS